MRRMAEWKRQHPVQYMAWYYAYIAVAVGIIYLAWGPVPWVFVVFGLVVVVTAIDEIRYFLLRRKYLRLLRQHKEDMEK